MVKLQKLSYTPVEIFNACTNNINSGTRKDHLLASKKSIINAGDKYDKLASQGKLTSLVVHKNVHGGATKDEMVWLYEKKFVADGGRD